MAFMSLKKMWARIVLFFRVRWMRRGLVRGYKNGPPQNAIDAAVQAAQLSPCQKSRRGVAIWNDNGLLEVGWNHQPGPFECDGSPTCYERCNRLCVHAEAHALLRCGPRARGAYMLHVKVVDGKAVEGGPPSCWQCSRLILESELLVMWLLESGKGWVPYAPEIFHLRTLEHAGLR